MKMYKVLIVEDDPMVAMINEQYIKKNKNFEIVGRCKDGTEALDFLENSTADLMILDVYMPRLNGFETLRQIRNRRIIIDAVLVTAANDKESLEEALHLGIVDYLVKPFTFERFQMALEKYIAQNNALKCIDTLSQTNIDHIIDNSRKKCEDLLPKGIQEKTLLLIMDQLRKNKGLWFTGDEISELLNLSSVTVRRYLNYLSETGKINSKMNYETGGRPCMRYGIA